MNYFVYGKRKRTNQLGFNFKALGCVDKKLIEHKNHRTF